MFDRGEAPTLSHSYPSDHLRSRGSEESDHPFEHEWGKNEPQRSVQGEILKA